MVEVHERYAYANAKMSSPSSSSTASSALPNGDFGPRKTWLILVIVIGCFAVLWPKVFYPMLVGNAHQHMKPSAIDKASGCCNVLSETDVHTIKIMSELCSRLSEEKSLSGPRLVAQCKQEVLQTCGIDISAVLQDKVKLGQTFKQILDEVRSLNGSLCLKYNFGVSPWKLGVRHLHNANFTDSTVPQERPPHLRPDMIHPAFRERGSAIPHATPSKPSRGPPPRIVEGKPGPIPGMRPPMGGAGHVVPPSQKGSNMGIIMPIYTIGIVIFFAYTLMKIMFKKQPTGPGAPLYPPVTPNPTFRKEVFEAADRPYVQNRLPSKPQSKLGWKERDAIVNAMSALLDEVDGEIESRRRAQAMASQQVDNATRMANGNVSNGQAVKPQEDDQTAVKVLGMETTASCEGGEKWTRSSEPVASSHTQIRVEPPQEIFLEGALPAQSKLLVTDAAIETQKQNDTSNDPAVVLAGKMTLSLISDTPDERNQQDEAQGTDTNGDEEAMDESKYITAENEGSDDEQPEDEQDDDLDVEIARIDTEHADEVSADESKPNHVGESSDTEE